MNHPGTKLFETITLEGTCVKQVMWPVHCVQGTHGAEFHPDLDVTPLESDKKGKGLLAKIMQRNNQ